MTLEEKIEFAKAMKEAGASEIVLEKNVEYEIGKVEAGGIGVQVNHYDSDSKSTIKRTRKQAPTTKVLPATFIYKWKDEHDGHLRLVKLYQLLTSKNCGWLEANHEDWCALFMGEPKEFTMKWRGTQQHLYYLFKVLTNKKYILCPKGVGKWIIVGSHFLNNDSRPFDDWNSQQDPIKAKAAIEKLAEVLNPSTDLSEY